MCRLLGKMGENVVEISKSYAVIVNIESDDIDDTVECKSYAEACQMANSIIKNNESTECFVIVRYTSDEQYYDA